MCGVAENGIRVLILKEGTSECDFSFEEDGKRSKFLPPFIPSAILNLHLIPSKFINIASIFILIF